MQDPVPGSQDSVDSSPLLPLPAPAAQKKIFRWFFFGFFAFLLYQLLLILSLFADVIIWASSLALVFWPLHAWFQRRLPGRPAVSAGFSTIGVLLLVLIPLMSVFTVVVAQSAQLIPTLQQWLATMQSADDYTLMELLPDFMEEWWLQLTAWMDSMPILGDFDFAGFLLGNADTLSSKLANLGAATARNILFGFINMLLIVVLMYFCFRDGEKFLRWFFDVLPMESRHAQEVAGRAYDMVTAVIRGALLTAFMQGALALVGYLIAGVPLSLFFGVLTGFSALIPVVGAGLIWLPVGIFIFMQDPTWGIFLLLWGFFLVSLIDNLLKPIFIGSRTRMPILLIFCAMIGGANVYGVTGFIIGPILMSVLLAFISIFREYYLADGPATGQAKRAELESSKD
jgi:predicted PurR-regulated permease PerM